MGVGSSFQVRKLGDKVYDLTINAVILSEGGFIIEDDGQCKGKNRASP